MKSIKSIDKNGNIFWKLPDGTRHREYRPAIIWKNGYEEWFYDGKRHCDSGPAFTGLQHKAWYINGRRHRLDGPAIDRSDGSKAWFINGERFTEKEFKHELVKLNLQKLQL